MTWGYFLAGLCVGLSLMGFIMNYGMSEHMKSCHDDQEHELELEKLRYADPKKYAAARGALKPDLIEEFTKQTGGKSR